MDVGVLGLGNMGRAMATNLAKAGHTVRVWNRSPGPAEALASAGCVPVASAAEAFSGDAAITMFADDAALRGVIVEGGLLEKAAPPAMHIAMATISLALAKEMTERHAAAGIGYLAAPVLGRTEVAVAGKLNILAAGPADLLARAQPLFDALGQKTWSLGEEPWRANVVKIAANTTIAASIQTMAEAFALGQAHGIDPHLLQEVLVGTLYGGRIHTNYGTLIADGQYEPAAFALTLGLKDIRLALAAGEAAHVPLPIASLLRDGFIDAIAQGDGALDWSALAKVTFRRAGLDR